MIAAMARKVQASRRLIAIITWKILGPGKLIAAMTHKEDFMRVRKSWAVPWEVPKFYGGSRKPGRGCRGATPRRAIVVIIGNGSQIRVAREHAEPIPLGRRGPHPLAGGMAGAQ